MKITVGSVVFIEALDYFDDFMESLQKQTLQDFDILLINDNIPVNLLQDKLKSKKWICEERIHITDKNLQHLLPHELRIELLNKALEYKTDLLILLDCDDKAKSNRIEEAARQYYDKYSFFYNEILQFDGRKIMPWMPSVTDKIDFLLEKNYLGLSNSAINMRHITKEFIESLREGKTKIFDWYLFSRMLLNGMMGIRVDNTCTYYRIYHANIAGVSKCTKELLEKEKQVKLMHYQLMRKYDRRYERLIDKYKKLRDDRVNCDSDSKLYFWWGLLAEEKN